MAYSYCSRAFSYTHRDVYKRQIVDCIQGSGNVAMLHQRTEIMHGIRQVAQPDGGKISVNHAMGRIILMAPLPVGQDKRLNQLRRFFRGNRSARPYVIVVRYMAVIIVLPGIFERPFLDGALFIQQIGGQLSPQLFPFWICLLYTSRCV